VSWKNDGQIGNEVIMTNLSWNHKKQTKREEYELKITYVSGKMG